MFLLAAVSLLFAQTPPPGNPACALLTTAQITSLIGAATPVPVAASATASACMFNAGDKTLTVTISHHASLDKANLQFGINKGVVKGEPIPGWAMPSYAGSRPSAALVGYLKGQIFYDVKMADPALSTEAVGIKLLAVLKDVAAR